MNAEQFFKIARRIKWHVDADDGVRAVHVRSGNSAITDGKMCPLAYVTKRVLGEEKWSSSEDLALPPVPFQNRVINAADSHHGRTWLLRSLGLVK